MVGAECVGCDGSRCRGVGRLRGRPAGGHRVQSAVAGEYSVALHATESDAGVRELVRAQVLVIGS